MNHEIHEAIPALPALIGDASSTSAALMMLGEASLHSRALSQLAEQSIRRGIDYRTLGQNWDHPQTRMAYRRAEGASFSKPTSRVRQDKSKLAMQALVTALATLPAAEPRQQAEVLLIRAFCEEIGDPTLAANATFEGVAAALHAELLLPMRAFHEGIRSMHTTFNGTPIPPKLINAAVRTLLEVTLNGTYSEWRYTNPVGAAQLAGLSAAQIAKWREPTATTYGPLTVHEDAPGELGLWWATKIGGPSHGFDFEGQCLLPLLCNARHKVILVSDPAYPYHPCGRAHFRLLWVHGTEPPTPILWLETINVDFALGHRQDTRAWTPAVLLHAASKAAAMGVGLSVESHLARELGAVVSEHLGGAITEVTQVSDRLVLRPSNGVLEASDYLTDEHDWVQVDEQVTAPLRRAMYAPTAGAAHAAARPAACGVG